LIPPPDFRLVKSDQPVVTLRGKTVIAWVVFGCFFWAAGAYVVEGLG
jgi:uncharacterized membrane protein